MLRLSVVLLAALLAGSPDHLSAAEAGSGGMLTRQRANRCDPATVTSADPGATAAIDRGAFRTAAHFRENVSSDAEVRIAWLGSSFRGHFLSRVEYGAAAITYTQWVLSRSARNDELAIELEGRSETTLAGLWCLLRAQPAGEAGPLLTDSTPNLLFLRDTDGELWTIDVLWGGAGWEIGASPRGSDRLWDAGTRIISR